jgi:hypothetical protein
MARSTRGTGRRLIRALFRVVGPAQVGLPPFASDEEKARYLADRARASAPPAPSGARDHVPPGYHLETYVDESGVTRRVARRD